MWLGEKYYQRMLRDMSEIDVLGSYIYQEKYVNQFLTGITKRVNLDGYYAPFLWKNPWTRVLEGKEYWLFIPLLKVLDTSMKITGKNMGGPECASTIQGVGDIESCTKYS